MVVKMVNNKGETFFECSEAEARQFIKIKEKVNEEVKNQKPEFIFRKQLAKNPDLVINSNYSIVEGLIRALKTVVSKSSMFMMFMNATTCANLRKEVRDIEKSAFWRYKNDYQMKLETDPEWILKTQCMGKIIFDHNVGDGMWSKKHVHLYVIKNLTEENSVLVVHNTNKIVHINVLKEHSLVEEDTQEKSTTRGPIIPSNVTFSHEHQQQQNWLKKLVEDISINEVVTCIFVNKENFKKLQKIHKFKIKPATIGDGTYILHYINKNKTRCGFVDSIEVNFVTGEGIVLRTQTKDHFISLDELKNEKTVSTLKTSLNIYQLSYAVYHRKKKPCGGYSGACISVAKNVEDAKKFATEWLLKNFKRDHLEHITPRPDMEEVRVEFDNRYKTKKVMLTEGMVNTGGIELGISYLVNNNPWDGIHYTTPEDEVAVKNMLERDELKKKNSDLEKEIKKLKKNQAAERVTEDKRCTETFSKPEYCPDCGAIIEIAVDPVKQHVNIKHVQHR